MEMTIVRCKGGGRAPSPAIPPSPPDPDAEEAKRSAAEEKKSRQRRRGRQASLATAGGPLGDVSPAPTYAPAINEKLG